jgi:hypothetical protein
MLQMLGTKSVVEETICPLEEIPHRLASGCFDGRGAPTRFPSLNPDGEYLLVGFRTSEGAEVSIAECETLEEMKEVARTYSIFGELTWYVGNDTGMETITEADGIPTA